jgi:hypothetical protein
VFGALCILGWAIPALLMADKGFSIQDEGTYLLSYSRWDTNPYFLSGAQYVYGPVFHLVGESVPALRVIRLAMALAANAWFGWVFCSWLATYRRLDLATSTRVAGTTLLTAAGGMTYLWSPLSPGYYDLAAVSTLALAGLTFTSLRRSLLGLRPQPWNSLLMGAVAFCLIGARWPAVTAVILCLAITLLAARATHRGVTQHLVTSLLGAALTAFLTTWLLVPLPRVVPVIAEVSRLSASGAHSLPVLAREYAASTALFVLAGLVMALPALIAVAMTLRASQPSESRASAGPAFLALALPCLAIPLAGGWRGGGEHGRVVVAAIVACLISAALAGPVSGYRPASTTRSRAERNQGAGAAGLLLVLPVAHALGTNIPLLYEALECAALWVAVGMLVGTSRLPSPAAHAFVGGSVALCVGLVSLLAGSTTLISPFKTTGFADSSASVPGLGGLEVSPSTADQFSALREGLASHLQPSPAPFYSLDGLNGLVFMLGGSVLGSPWTDVDSPERSAAILRLACRNGDVDPTRAPILLLNRPLDTASIHALAACGFAFPDDYIKLSVEGGPPGVTVYVPS